MGAAKVSAPLSAAPNRLGKPGNGDRRRRVAHSARQSFPRHAGARPSAAEDPREIDGALVDLKDIKGQESAKRALEVAAGGHNLQIL